jgi:cytosine/uracil/thiamine/allantoin permease
MSTAWLEQFASFTLILAGLLVPIGGILLAHYFVLRRPVQVPDLYDQAGPYARYRGWSAAGISAWVVGAAVFYAAGRIGATLPSLAASVLVYVLITRLFERSR